MDPILYSKIKKTSSPTDEQVSSAVDSYLKENPVETYDDTEIQATVSSLSSSLNSNIPYIYKNFVTPEMYGAVGDGETDDTLSFQNMLSSLYEKRYGRVVVLGINKTYKTSEALPINHDVIFICPYYNSNAKIINTTTDMFYVPDENLTENRIWSYGFRNVILVGGKTTSFITQTESTVQHWMVSIMDVKMSGFGTLFPYINIYASRIQNLTCSDINYIGILSGSDNVFSSSMITQNTGLSSTDETPFLELNSLSLTRFSDWYLTGNVSVPESIVKCTNGCDDIEMRGVWFDYSGGCGLEIVESTAIKINSCTFRGNSVIDSNSYAYLKLAGCSNITAKGNSFLPSHLGDAYQRSNAYVYRIYDYSGYVMRNITIKDNLIKVPFLYAISPYSRSSKFLIDEKSVNFKLDFTERNILPIFSKETSNLNGITYENLGNNRFIVNGTATANSTLYLLGAYSSTNVVLTIPAGKYFVRVALNDINYKTQQVGLRFFNNTTVLGTYTTGDTIEITEDTEVTAICLYVSKGITEDNVNVELKLLVD